MPSQPHDVLFHWLIANPDEARSLLTGLLPSAIVDCVDWSGLTVEVSRIDSPELVTRVPDAICRAPLFLGGSLEIAIVMEHQSRPHDDMPIRMAVSQAMLWTEDERLDRPPSVAIGLVLHHGPRPWSSPLTVRERFGLPSELDDAIGAYLPSHPYLVIDLATMSKDVLAKLPLSSPLVRTTLFALQRAREATAIEEELVLVQDDLRAIATRADAEQALTAIFRYLLTVVPQRAEPIRERLTNTLPKDIEEHIMGTIFDEHVEKGIAIGEARGEARGQAIGEARGRAMGEARGQVMGRAAILVEQLEAKFGPLSRELRDVVDNGSGDDVSVWARRVLFAESLDEVFATRS